MTFMAASWLSRTRALVYGLRKPGHRGTRETVQSKHASEVVAYCIPVVYMNL
jgi:hypothetical protein